ncbi:hypothetical protein Hanom_Chr10g00912191 [Helianthus anomalus]
MSIFSKILSYNSLTRGRAALTRVVPNLQKPNSVKPIALIPISHTPKYQSWRDWTGIFIAQQKQKVKTSKQ